MAAAAAATTAITPHDTIFSTFVVTFVVMPK
jgi:hypothetical protein